MFSKVLVANRGEIAIRVFRTLEELGIGTVAVYSEPDRDAPHARRAAEAYLVGPGPANQSYLVVEKIIEAASKSGAEAIHPGYGFLAENAAFARACDEAGIVFIGPPAEAIDAMGSKTRARDLMKEAGVPIVPGTTDSVDTVEDAARSVDDEMRERIGKIGTEAAGAVGYRSAGTVEGLLADGEYFFLEMNTRVQVEHCVTEMTTGIDIVREQLRIAAGEELSIAQDDVRLSGHAIECRVNAEDAAKNFAPAPGTITSYREPSGPGVRVGSGVEAGYEITPLYDPMIAQPIGWDVDRESATRRMGPPPRGFEAQ